ncbi:hypothetical protein KY309_03635 [Candidatus Woesearchaeota archaeon]|nr:hypothetical protein [Candidatus Woesearchaeota archaeon]
MRYVLLLLLLMITAVQAQYYLPYEPQANSNSAEFITRIGPEPVPPSQPRGGGSAASKSYSVAVPSVRKPSTEQQTQTPALPQETQKTYKTAERQPEEYKLAPGETPTITITPDYTVPKWYLALSAAALLCLKAIL